MKKLIKSCLMILIFVSLAFAYPATFSNEAIGPIEIESESENINMDDWEYGDTVWITISIGGGRCFSFDLEESADEVEITIWDDEHDVVDSDSWTNTDHEEFHVGFEYSGDYECYIYVKDGTKYPGGIGTWDCDYDGKK